MKKNKAIFLDRDGTINKEINYLHKPEDFKFLPRIPDALKKLQNEEYYLIVITNQAGIGKGFYDHLDVNKLHNFMKEQLEQMGVHILDIFYCPHSSDNLCKCRKPHPKLILDAIQKYNIDPNDSWMIGDKISDIEAGNNAKLNTILVRTGYGSQHEEIILKNPEKNIQPKYIVQDLWDATEKILNM